MTPGQIQLEPDGTLIRSMNVRDGYSIKVATGKGYRVAIISGGQTPAADERLRPLGISEIYLGVKDKLVVYKSFIEAYGLKEEHILYMGDDLPDYRVMKRVGLPCCPRDSVDEIIDLSLYISPFKGGEGCVRDVIEKVLKLRGDWPGYPTLQIDH